MQHCARESLSPSRMRGMANAFCPGCAAHPFTFGQNRKALTTARSLFQPATMHRLEVAVRLGLRLHGPVVGHRAPHLSPPASCTPLFASDIKASCPGHFTTQAESGRFIYFPHRPIFLQVENRPGQVTVAALP